MAPADELAADPGTSSPMPSDDDMPIGTPRDAREPTTKERGDEWHDDWVQMVQEAARAGQAAMAAADQRNYDADGHYVGPDVDAGMTAHVYGSGGGGGVLGRDTTDVTAVLAGGAVRVEPLALVPGREWIGHWMDGSGSTKP